MIERLKAFITRKTWQLEEKNRQEYIQRALDRIAENLKNCESQLSCIASQLRLMNNKEEKRDQLSQKDLLDLRIQEYIALRSEQRTRLDAANKIIHYYAIVIAAIVASSLSLYKNVLDVQEFKEMFQNVLLLIPLITLPFAFAQQNEEIIVRNIGSYFSEIDIGRPSRAFPVTPPCIRVRTRRFGWSNASTAPLTSAVPVLQSRH